MQPREPMHSFEIPPAPGLVIHADHFECASKEYLLLVDGFSGWAEARIARNRTPAEVIRILREYMSRNGIPRQFHSDQGSPFMAAEFRRFCQEWGIKATEGSAKHPRGNAIAEAYVKKLKRALSTAKDDDDLMRALLAMRQTPVAPGRPSPAELHLGRTLRGELTAKVEQTVVDWAEMKEWKMAVAAERGKQFNKGTRPLPELAVGEQVWVWHGQRWIRGVISRVMQRPRSYEVLLSGSGQRIQRNRQLIRTRPPGSTDPVVKKTNPQSLLQVPGLTTPKVPLLSYVVLGGSGASTLPSTTGNRPGTPPDQEPGISPQSRNRTPPPPTSPSGTGQAPPGTSQSARSSRSYASTLQSPTSSGEPSSDDYDEQTSTDEMDTTEGSSDEATPGTPPPTTRAGRVVRPPNKYSPSDY